MDSHALLSLAVAWYWVATARVFFFSWYQSSYFILLDRYWQRREEAVRFY